MIKLTLFSSNSFTSLALLSSRKNKCSLKPLMLRLTLFSSYSFTSLALLLKLPRKVTLHLPTAIRIRLKALLVLYYCSSSVTTGTGTASQPLLYYYFASYSTTPTPPCPPRPHPCPPCPPTPPFSEFSGFILKNVNFSQKYLNLLDLLLVI